MKTDNSIISVSTQKSYFSSNIMPEGYERVLKGSTSVFLPLRSHKCLLYDFNLKSFLFNKTLRMKHSFCRLYSARWDINGVAYYHVQQHFVSTLRVCCSQVLRTLKVPSKNVVQLAVPLRYSIMWQLHSLSGGICFLRRPDINIQLKRIVEASYF